MSTLCGVARRRPDHDAAGRVAVRDLESGDGRRRGLEVAHVDRAGRQRTDDGSFQRTRGSRNVARGRDDVTLLQRGRIRRSQADGEFGRDLDVDEAGDSARPEEVALPARLPDHAGVDERAGFDRLERIDLHPGRDVGLFLDDALVADDGALFDPRGAHDVGVLADDATAQVRLRPDEDVVVHDRAMQERAALHDDVAAEHRVLAQLGAAFDLGVVADVERAFQDRFGVDLGALARPRRRASSRSPRCRRRLGGSARRPAPAIRLSSVPTSSQYASAT